jgi:hypothetical protein
MAMKKEVHVTHNFEWDMAKVVRWMVTGIVALAALFICGPLALKYLAALLG